MEGRELYNREVRDIHFVGKNWDVSRDTPGSNVNCKNYYSELEVSFAVVGNTSFPRSRITYLFALWTCSRGILESSDRV